MLAGCYSPGGSEVTCVCVCSMSSSPRTCSARWGSLGGPTAPRHHPVSPSPGPLTGPLGSHWEADAPWRSQRSRRSFYCDVIIERSHFSKQAVLTLFPEAAPRWSIPTSLGSFLTAPTAPCFNEKDERGAGWENTQPSSHSSPSTTPFTLLFVPFVQPCLALTGPPALTPPRLFAGVGEVTLW